VLSHKNRDSQRGPKRDGIGRAGVNIHKLPVEAYVYSRIECMPAKVIDYDFLDLAPHLFDYAFEQLVGHRTGRHNPFQATVYGKYFGDSDYDGKTALAVAFLENYYLLIGTFINDYTRQFNFDIHTSPWFV
jgi:hypothetical protein